MIVSGLADTNGVAAGQWHSATGIVIAAGNSTSTIFPADNGSLQDYTYMQGYLVPKTGS